MFDPGMFEGFKAFWVKAVAAQMPDAQEEIFKAKLSRLGVKAPFGTPPAEQQLAKAVAKANINGTFMGHEVVNGVNHDVIKSQLIVDKNISVKQAEYLTNRYFEAM